jgi:hypothetical protein
MPIVPWVLLEGLRNDPFFHWKSFDAISKVVRDDSPALLQPLALLALFHILLLRYFFQSLEHFALLWPQKRFKLPEEFQFFG